MTVTDRIGEQPYWQTRSCGPWCEAVHTDEDVFEDRVCCGQSRVVPLTLEPCTPDGSDKAKSRPAVFSVELVQQYEAAAPHISVLRSALDEPIRFTRMSPDEADELGDYLKELAKFARGTA